VRQLLGLLVSSPPSSQLWRRTCRGAAHATACHTTQTAVPGGVAGTHTHTHTHTLTHTHTHWQLQATHARAHTSTHAGDSRQQTCTRRCHTCSAPSRASRAQACQTWCATAARRQAWATCACVRWCRSPSCGVDCACAACSAHVCKLSHARHAGACGTLQRCSWANHTAWPASGDVSRPACA
jgi:hypothetical protein